MVDVRADNESTYIIEATGKRKEIKDISEKYLINTIKFDLMDFFAPEGSYRRNYRTRLDCFILSDLIKGNFIPSAEGALELYKLVPVYGEVVFKLIKDFDYISIIKKAIVIGTYLKESHNDFSHLTYNEMIAVLEQMTNNEKEKEYMITKKI